MIWFAHDFNPLKPRRGVTWTEVSIVEALQRIGGADALVAWDRDVTQSLVLNRTWATVCESGGRVWLSKVAHRPLPIDVQHVWSYSRPMDTAPIGGWSPIAYLRDLFDQVVFDVGVPTRARTPFKDNGILFVGELVSQSADQLAGMYNLGKTTLHGIQRSLSKHGLSLSMDVGAWTPPSTSLTWSEPVLGPYDVTFDCELFYYARTCSWHPVQWRVIRPPPDGVGYAIAHRTRNYTSDWNHLASWSEVLMVLNRWRMRNVQVVEDAPPG